LIAPPAKPSKSAEEHQQGRGEAAEELPAACEEGKTSFATKKFYRDHHRDIRSAADTPVSDLKCLGISLVVVTCPWNYKVLRWSFQELRLPSR